MHKVFQTYEKERLMHAPVPVNAKYMNYHFFNIIKMAELYLNINISITAILAGTNCF